MLRAAAIIPARFNSTRFPGKPLSLLKGKPVIQYVYEQTSLAKLTDAVFVATDDKGIFDAVTNFGGKAVMTSPSHASGTDRIAEAARDIDCDIIVNVQGDEPFIKPEMVDDVVKLLLDDPSVSIGTLAARIKTRQDVVNENVVKVVFNNDGFALYFSRSPIPFHRDEWTLQSIEHSLPRTFYCYKHIGIYAYRKDVLLKLSKLPQTKLEKIEKLEQLRALENGIKIKVKETAFETTGIDTPEDLRRAEEWLNSYS
ncbi:MAG: 3-deoxy-manno-octulosonate cytidylyltransferase [Nitrospirae bacterium]|nr:3-deoxy-manno-octulosonate cytidylyltransferase [Nitrospirota bacterium]